ATGFARVLDVRQSLTPELHREVGDTALVLIDLGGGRNRLGASVLAQVYGTVGHEPADLDDPAHLVGFFAAIRQLASADKLLAYHDRSDGGLATALVEMAFAGGTGLEIAIDNLGRGALAALFSEELGAVVQVRREDLVALRAAFAEHGLGEAVHELGTLRDDDRIIIMQGGVNILAESRFALRDAWSETTRRMQALRDDEGCAEEEHATRLDGDDPGLCTVVPFALDDDPAAPFIATGVRPKVAILREQGVNGHIEMAAAFDRAGFDAVDVHMSDLLASRVELDDFHGLTACGGFSYGDVLGAGEGWAKSILFHDQVRDSVAGFFAREDTFALGICNGCQMLSNLHEIIPGSEHWPRFVRNRSEQFEARLSLVEITPSPSVLLAGMEGARLPIAVAHGEGRAEFADEQAAAALDAAGQVGLRYVDGHGRVATTYPANPNGSPQGVAGVTSTDGRVTILMPHPERVFRTVQHSWAPQQWAEHDAAPWLRLFRNARAWLG
ncbi:MAG: phosphoribosylformylglycinamidine synthase subunit PurQ, partial [bacterium]